MKCPIVVISLLQLSALCYAGVGNWPWSADASSNSCTVTTDGCENSCVAQGKTCCFCDQTRDFNLQACFCCPKNHFCCPSDTWWGGSAHCCPSGYKCTTGGRCSVLDDIPGVAAQGVSGFQCRKDTYVYVTVDNSFSMFIDGKQKELSNPNTWEIADKVLIPASAKLITICGTNKEYGAGILISSEDPDLLARARWKCYSSVDKCPGWWTNLQCDDNAWPQAVVGERNDGLGTRTRVPYIPTTTRWMWCNGSNSTHTKDWAPACTCRIWLPDTSDVDGRVAIL